MPEYHPETFSRYTYDPDSGGWAWEGAESPVPVGIEEVTGGAIFQRGPNLYESGTSRYIGRVAFARGSVLEVGSYGSVLLTNAREQYQVGRDAGPERQYRAVVQGDFGAIGLPGTELVNRTISLTPFGAGIYARGDVPPSKERYVRLQLAERDTVNAPASVGEYQLVHSRELVQRGLVGWVSRNLSAQIDRAVTEARAGEGAFAGMTGSEIVKMIAANITVTPAITYVLRRGSA